MKLPLDTSTRSYLCPPPGTRGTRYLEAYRHLQLISGHFTICKDYSRIRKVLIPWLVSVLGLAIADVLSCSGVMIIMIASYARYIKILLG